MKDLLKRTFTGEFDTDNFILFTKNLFNEIDIEPREISVSSGFGEYIKKLTYLGEYSDSQKRNIDVLIVELIGDTKVERARSFQRNLVAKFLKDNTKDAGLVAFYSADNPDWRLSFVKMDYRIGDKGVKAEVGTPPKRYSFLVGETEPSHTAQKQLFPILNDRKNNPLISELEEAFSVEKVTREFYEKYRFLFEKLAKNLNKNKSFQIIASKENIDIDNFAKKLLGQIVFLYFLQKKGWLGVPSDKVWGQGDKLFLRTLFDKAKSEKKNFYNDYLEHLFYDTLNNPRRNEVDPSYSNYFGSKIPFLNGGLFEPDYDWENTIIYLENDIFEDIIDTFDLYNFTVKEDEPLEKEVAVDPEMLGKVFENLLPENLRKGQGAYYTPREIVHYMCQESLINYLTTETKIGVDKIRKLVVTKHFDGAGELIDRVLQNVKVCDPACGSGAFLVGMLHEIVSARRLLNHEKDEYHLKKEAIQNCIYGVDVDPGAVEIAKLRLWLSLVVDYELKDIEPLPNLDYKIMCGNSLLDELVIGDETIKLFDEKLLNVSKNKKTDNALFNIEGSEHKSGSAKNEYLLKLVDEKQKEIMKLHADNQLTFEKRRTIEREIAAINKELNPKQKRSKSINYHPTLFIEDAEKYFVTLKELHKQYFTEYDPVKKKDKRKQIGQIELEFIKSSIHEKVESIDNTIKNLNMQLESDRKRHTVLLKKKLEYLAIPEQIISSKTRPYFLWKLNYFEVFQEKSGFDVIIANPPYIRHRDLDKKLKDTLKDAYKTGNTTSDIYCYFYELSYNLLCKEGVSSFITSNKWMRAQYGQNLRVFFKDNTAMLQIIDLGSGQFSSATVDTSILIFKKRIPPQDHQVEYEFKIPTLGQQNIPKISQKLLEDDSFTLTNPANLRLKEKIEKMGLPLSRWSNLKINYGVLTGKNEIKTQKGKEGVFIIDKKTRDDLISSDSSSSSLIHPVLRGKDVSRYLIQWSDKYIIAMYYGSHEVIDKFPAIKDHLYKYRKILESRAQVIRGDHHWLELDQNPSKKYIEEFKQPKIIYPVISSEASFTYDDLGYFHNDKVFHIVGENLKFLLGFLNSKLAYWLIRHYGPCLGDMGFEFRKIFVEKLPIPKISTEEQKPFIEIVNHILVITKSSGYLENPEKKEKVKEYESQIDKMVYKLYDLEEKEIEIIEDSNKDI